jgi:hypothetical protein
MVSIWTFFISAVGVLVVVVGGVVVVVVVVGDSVMLSLLLMLRLSLVLCGVVVDHPRASRT